MKVRTKGEQKAYLDGYEMCAECTEKYLTDEGKKKLECLLMAVRNAVEIEDISALSAEPCEDTISRIDVHKLLDDCTLGGWVEVEGKNFHQLVSELPSVQPVRPKGKWIEIGRFDGEIYYDCSECGESFCLIDGLTALSNFCPNCGADMRGGKE